MESVSAAIPDKKGSVDRFTIFLFAERWCFLLVGIGERRILKRKITSVVPIQKSEKTTLRNDFDGKRLIKFRFFDYLIYITQYSNRNDLKNTYWVSVENNSGRAR